MRVIFVGLHNKPGMMPLDSKTKSGKLIDRIIEPLQQKGFYTLKTNLFDVDYVPGEKEIGELVFQWIERVQLFNGDTVVLLGAMVHKYFPELPSRIIKIAHPASKRNHAEMDEYVKDAISQILVMNIKQVHI